MKLEAWHFPQFKYTMCRFVTVCEWQEQTNTTVSRDITETLSWQKIESFMWVEMRITFCKRHGTWLYLWDDLLQRLKALKFITATISMTALGCELRGMWDGGSHHVTKIRRSSVYIWFLHRYLNTLRVMRIVKCYLYIQPYYTANKLWQWRHHL